MRTPPPALGEQFGRWTVIGESFMQSPGHRAVRCKCSCGVEKDVLVFALRKGQSTSCGCHRREQARVNLDRTVHGYAKQKHPLYALWKRIRRRCNDPKSTQYRWYGARGIKVWTGWEEDAAMFIEYIEIHLGPRPKGMSLDRIDNDGNYEPGNLRWATAKEQVANSRIVLRGDGC
jgi:hypothetical protein